MYLDELFGSAYRANPLSISKTMIGRQSLRPQQNGKSRTYVSKGVDVSSGGKRLIKLGLESQADGKPDMKVRPACVP
jgi:hypothetical protein